MTQFKIITEGYAKETTDGWVASSTTTLIRDNGHIIIVDPGINRQLFLKGLKKEGLTPTDIDIVFMTHYHPDHIFLISMFEHATVYDGNTIYKGDQESEYQGTLPDTSIKVISTPGHAHEHASLILETDQGKVVVAADLFWWTDQQAQKTDNAKTLINKKDPFTQDWSALQQSRRRVLKLADYIIPGHGHIFKNLTK